MQLGGRKTGGKPGDALRIFCKQGQNLLNSE
jgi:hypothetical protein